MQYGKISCLKTGKENRNNVRPRNVIEEIEVCIEEILKKKIIKGKLFVIQVLKPRA